MFLPLLFLFFLSVHRVSYFAVHLLWLFWTESACFSKEMSPTIVAFLMDAGWMLHYWTLLAWRKQSNTMFHLLRSPSEKKKKKSPGNTFMTFQSSMLTYVCQYAKHTGNMWKRNKGENGSNVQHMLLVYWLGWSVFHPRFHKLNGKTKGWGLWMKPNCIRICILFCIFEVCVPSCHVLI